MNDQNLVNKPVSVEQIIEALRCTSAPGGPIGDCEKCPFWKTENLTAEQAKQLGTDKWKSCDIDRVGIAAADRLANDQTHIAALQQEIEKLRSGRRWIPVTERLPEPMKWVLGVCTNGSMRTLRYDPVTDDYDFAVVERHCYCISAASVTHWMPLPEAPGSPEPPEVVFTNADRVREMNDEEMAKFMLSCDGAAYCKNDDRDSTCYLEGRDGMTACELCVLDWLRKEAEVE